MTKILVLDTGPAGKIAHPSVSPEVRQWLQDRAAAGDRFVLPEIVDYELRRNFPLEIRRGRTSFTRSLKTQAILHSLCASNAGCRVNESLGQLIRSPTAAATTHPYARLCRTLILVALRAGPAEKRAASTKTVPSQMTTAGKLKA